LRAGIAALTISAAWILLALFLSREQRIKRTLLLFITLIFLGVIITSRTQRGFATPQIFLFGIDGATWDLIEPMVQENQLPTFKALMDAGCYGRLSSLDPTWSPRVWTSLMTGVIPERHGIYDFGYGAEHLRFPRLWDILIQKQWTSWTYRWLLTWPPPPSNTITIPSWLDHSEVADPLLFTPLLALSGNSRWRKGIPVSTILSSFQLVYTGVRLSTYRQGLRSLTSLLNKARQGIPEDHLLPEWLELWTRIDGDVLSWLLIHRPAQVCAFSIYGVDTLGHRFWRYMAPEGFDGLIEVNQDLYQDVIPNIYRQMDTLLGQALQRLPDSCLVVLASDHGFQEGTPLWYKADLHAGRLEQDLALGERLRVLGEGELGRIVLLDAHVAPTSDLMKAEQILRESHVVQDGSPLFLVERRGSTLDFCIRAHVHEQTEVVIGSIQDKLSRWASIHMRSGEHAKHGIILFRGPHIRAGTLVNGMSILDVIPTILYLIGETIPEGLNGRAFTEIADEFYGTMHTPRYGPAIQFDSVLHPQEKSTDTPEHILRALKELGYFSSGRQIYDTVEPQEIRQDEWKTLDLCRNSLKQGDIHWALRILEETDTTSSHVSEHFLLLEGLCFVHLEQEEEARQRLESVLARGRPELINEALWGLAMLDWKSGDSRTAMLRCETALNRVPGDPLIHRLLGNIYASLGSQVRAIVHLRASIQGDVEDHQTLDLLSTLLENNAHASRVDLQ